QSGYVKKPDSSNRAFSFSAGTLAMESYPRKQWASLWISMGVFRKRLKEKGNFAMSKINAIAPAP
ncbi:MAG TPA: hypothetical protein VIG66_02415, partial [Noviherbaspirillum sp.]